MFIEYIALKKMCSDFPTEFNRGYILALVHNKLITPEIFCDLEETITESNYYRGDI